MSLARVLLAVAWAVSVALPLGWWLLARRRAGAPVAVPAAQVATRRQLLLGELAARTAHDIVTPLSAAAGHLDLIAHEPVSDTVARSVRVCAEQVARASALAADLRALTAVRAGSAPRRRVNAAVLAEEAVAALLADADAAGARLSLALPGEPVYVEVADGDLTRALRNLVRNALVHGLGERREVAVAVAADAWHVTFSVADSGPGLPAALAAGAGAVAGELGAVGSLGLAIVAEVLAAHGTRLVTAAPARAEVSFTLPRCV